ncbi:hypothetical protein [Kitasatospora phosalacinea]|uniref:Uncharacterized protein n=1 Tax=Kitasatospora phosalacinea TaxID=2065 RepID=A0A9W6PNN8_9ACTN|nr:hypothetical protein [Kitasatospora phosalacinea]GLW58189.1 hypothetical protein Kpho01_62000 [Kitasatospora phosalacinea]
MDAAVAAWPSRPGEPFRPPSTELAAEQLTTLQALHTRAVAVSVQPLPDPFAAPDVAETARREAAAAARTVSRIAYASYFLSDVLEIAVDTQGRGRPPGPLSLDYAESAYRSASDALAEAAQSLHLHTDHLAGRPDSPRNQYGAVRRAAARLRAAVRPAAEAALAPAAHPAAPAPAAAKPSPRR